MELNCKRGKSNFVFRFFGTGAKAEREYLENVLDNRIQFKLVDGTESSIEAIDIYKHLGSKIGVGSSNRPEIVTRMAVVTTKTFKFRKPILQNDDITENRRISLAQSSASPFNGRRQTPTTTRHYFAMPTVLPGSGNP